MYLYKDRVYNHKIDDYINSTSIRTGLPTKDETSETTVRNLYLLFPYIYDSLQLTIFFVSLPNHYKSIFRSKDLIKP